MESDSVIAGNIVRTIFKHINLCLKTNNSKVRINMFEKGAIQGMLNDKVLNGINSYINNMNPMAIKSLMDEIDFEIKKRG